MTTATRKPAEIRRELRIPTPRLPEAIDKAPAAIAKPGAEYADLRARASAAIEAVIALERQRPAVAKSDREAQTAALRANEDSPGTTAQDQLAADLEAATGEARALIDATADVWGDLVSALADHLPAWIAKTDDAEAKEGATGAEALASVEQSARKLAQIRALREWQEKAQKTIRGDTVGSTRHRDASRPRLAVSPRWSTSGRHGMRSPRCWRSSASGSRWRTRDRRPHPPGCRDIWTRGEQRMRAGKACADPHCPNLQPCELHAPKPWASSTRRTKVKSGWAQQREAKSILARYRGICHVCGLPGADEVDHVIPIAEGGSDRPSNKRPIHSEPCHRVKTAAEAQRGRG